VKYLKNAGFSENFSIKVTNNRVVRINLRELERLCLILHCTPNDFYEWIPDKDDSVAADHPLNDIKKSGKVIDLTKMLHSIPLGYLEEVESVIQEKMKNIKSQKGNQ
jgi:DNA-binding Xre family transcriptional regulator